MSQEQAFHLSSQYRLLMKLAGVGLLFAAVIEINAPWLVWYLSRTGTVRLSFGDLGTLGILFECAGLAFFVLGIKALWIARHAERYTVTVNETGLGQPNHQLSTRSVLWSDIAELREHPYLQRIDIIDRAGHPRVKLHYQLEQFLELLQLVLSKVSPINPVVPLPAQFSAPSSLLVVAGIFTATLSMTLSLFWVIHSGLASFIIPIQQLAHLR